MSDLFLIRPAMAGATILDPDTGAALPPEGVERRRSPYWVGHEMHGDVTITPVADGADAPAKPAVRRKGDEAPTTEI